MSILRPQTSSILRFVLLLFAFISAPLLVAQSQMLELAPLFVDHAVLQRDIPSPVWGWGEPGSTVTVTFAGQTKTSKVDTQGEWKIELDPLEASAEGSDFTVTSSKGETLILQDLLVGEVWFSSGQSNMDWVAGKSMCRDLANALQRSEVEVPIREYNVDIGSALFPCKRTTSADGWKSSKSAGGFSALSLAFAWELHQELDVPIGIVRSTHGATQIETWTAYEGFSSHPQLQDIALKIRQSDPTTPESVTAFSQYYEDLRNWQIDSEELINRGGVALPRPPLPGIGDEWRGPTRMYNRKIAPLIPYGIRGVIWCHGTHNANDGKIYAAKMEALVNGLRENWERPDLPFYFTQMQCYGEPDPDNVGFADIREAQRLFFMNATNGVSEVGDVGMVLQHDLNPANPGAIHYHNKLDPGERLARWALSHQYGKDIAYTGPIYQSHKIEDDEVRVRFEQRGPGDGLMSGGKGLEADYGQETSGYVEPAIETPGELIQHFRLAGADRIWHPAEAKIEGDEVVVTSAAVPHPIGVQYAYSASPIGANLYNRAGLPATPFAYFDGEQLFVEDTPEAIAAAGAAELVALNPPEPAPYLRVMSLYRDRAVIQRDEPISVWGFALPGTKVTVTFDDQTKTAVAGEFAQWEVRLDPMSTSIEGRDLIVACDNGPTKTVRDIVIGDVWVLTGTSRITSEVALPRDPETEQPEAMPLVREFRLKTNTRRFSTPRKQNLEIGGDFRYQAFWRPVIFEELDSDTTTAAYYFAQQVHEENVPLGIISLGADNPPLTWISYDALQTAPGFEVDRDVINLAYPNTDSCKVAVEGYITTIQLYNRKIATFLNAGIEPPEELIDTPPAFPAPDYDQWSNDTETATYTYNFCISPLTPFAVRGVAWIPSEANIGEDASRYSAGLSAYAKSLADTYGQDEIAFVYAHPTVDLAPGVEIPEIENGAYVELNEWPSSLQDVAARLGELAAEN
jgi:hypothetical protein